MAAADYANVVQQLYVSYFGRPADYYGLQNFEAQLNTMGAPTTIAGITAAVQAGTNVALVNLVNSFNVAPESVALYGAGTTQIEVSKFVAAIYTNVLGRPADVAGANWWINEITTGRLTKANAALAISAGALTNTTAQGVIDAATITAKVAVASDFTTSVDTIAEINAYSGDAAAAAARTMLATVTNTTTVAAFHATVDATIAGVANSVGSTFTLTTGVDALTGTAGNDTFNAVIDATLAIPTSTLTALDTIDGGAGVDTLKINAITAFTVPGGATVSNVEKVQIAAADVVGAFNVTGGAAGVGSIDLSTVFAGVTDLTITSATEVDFKAPTTAAVNVSGVTGGVEVVGGASQTVSLAAQGGAVALSGATGAVSFTSAKHGNNAISIDGGSTVTVATTSTIDNASITIGATKPATGAVSVTSNLNGDGVATLDQGDITVTGGSTVTVNSNLTINAKDEAAGSAHTFGGVRVNSDGKTTSVTVNQTYAETEFTKAAVAVVKELHTVTFLALASGETTTVDGLTFKASKALTAAEVAQAFSSLTASDTQTSGGKVANGVFTGNLSANFTSGAASGAVVVFTAIDESETLVLTAGAVDPTQTVVAGTIAANAVTSTNGITYGAVRVDGNATASITTVNINGYSSADLGVAGTDLNALTTLSLANSGGTAGVATSAATLGLTVNKVAHDVTLTASSLKTLNVTATGADSTFGLVASAVETLTVSGDKVLDIDTGSTLTALKTVTVSGSAGLSIDASGANVTSVNTTATTGTVTATVDASKATYTGGAGVDNVTLSSNTVSKAISLGAGNDTLTLATGTQASTSTLSGGDGTDTLVMAVADAAAASATTVFATKIDGFEKLSLGAGANVTVDLANMDNISYVISANGAGTSAQAQISTAVITSTGTTDAGDTASITVGGTVFTTAAGIMTEDAIGAALVALIDGDAAYGATYTAGTNTIQVTAAVAGTAFTAPSAITITNQAAGTPDSISAVYATPTANVVAGNLTLTNMANNGTLELTAAGTGATVTMLDATGTADSFNIVTKVDASNLDFGTVVVAGVETVNITATDITPVHATTGVATISATTLALSDSAAKTVNVYGESDLTLSLAAATAVTAVNAGTFTGKLMLTATGSAAMTITGGTAADTLTASGSGDVLLGGAGNDILTGANLTTLTGGAGNDTFMMNKPSNVNSYSTITDLASGDVIDFGTASTIAFTSAAVNLAGTAVFQDYANAAVNALGTDADDAAWFQFSGNTYIVQSGDATANNDFQSGVDSIIQITGLVDLSTASYNQTNATLQIV